LFITKNSETMKKKSPPNPLFIGSPMCDSLSPASGRSLCYSTYHVDQHLLVKLSLICNSLLVMPTRLIAYYMQFY
jgi:hypothetical protein